jgi:hypothetical protein
MLAPTHPRDINATSFHRSVDDFDKPVWQHQASMYDDDIRGIPLSPSVLRMSGQRYDPSVQMSTPPMRTAEPSEWIEKYSEKKQKPYWKNLRTQKSTWKNPFMAPTLISSTGSPGLGDEPNIFDSDFVQHSAHSEWIEKYSVKKQKPYWKNLVTNKSTWRNPFSHFEEERGIMYSTHTPEPQERIEIAHPASTLADSNMRMNHVSDWEEKFSQSKQKSYWKHKITRETSWKSPHEITPSLSSLEFRNDYTSSARLHANRNLEHQRERVLFHEGGVEMQPRISRTLSHTRSLSPTGRSSGRPSTPRSTSGTRDRFALI